MKRQTWTDTGLVCGARTVKRAGPRDFRVVCATCEAGGNWPYVTRQEALRAASRNSDRPCDQCGAR